MRNAASALLYAAAFSSHFIGTANGEPPPLGRFGSRFRRSISNTTTPTIAPAELETPSPPSPQSSDLDQGIVASVGDPPAGGNGFLGFEDGLSSTSMGSTPTPALNTISAIDNHVGSTFGGVYTSDSYIWVTLSEESKTPSTPAAVGLTTITSTTRTWPVTPSPSSLSSSASSSSSSSSTSSTTQTSLPPSSPSPTTPQPPSGFSTGTFPSGNVTSGLWSNSTSQPFFSTTSITTTSDQVNETIPSITVVPTANCFSNDPDMPETVISVIFTSTLTWEGDPADYTPEYPPLHIPTPCEESTKTNLLSASTCDPSGKTCIVYAPTAGFSTFAPEISKGATQTYTYFTTEKNPAVVFETSSPAPQYGGTDLPADQTNDGHQTATQNENTGAPSYGGTPNSQGPQPMHESKTDVTVVARPTEVVINHSTIINNPASPTTTTVTVGTDVFIVGPTLIVGAGETVTRQAVNSYYPSPTTTTVAGLDIVVSRSVAIIEGTTFTVGATSATRMVDGQAVTLGPNGIGVSGITIPVIQAGPTQVVVAGGELITAIGMNAVVVEGRTYSYGPDSPAITKVIDDDTIIIGPTGVVIDGTLTMGGTAAVPGKASYQIVGGATISQVGVSVVVIEEATYTVGPGTGTTTTVVGGETITIAPNGVTVTEGMTLSYPFGPTMTTTLHPGGTATAVQASATSADDEEDSAFSPGRRPDWRLALFTTSIAIGVGIFGYIV